MSTRWLLLALDAAEHRALRVRCRVLRRHGRACRGRRDHVVDGAVIDPGRWS